MTVTLIDTPFSNRRNIHRALERAGASVTLSSSAETIASSARIVLPGVGAFAASMQWLRERGIDSALREAVSRGASLLGVCVGHQLLFESSSEMGVTAGLGFLSGEVAPFDSMRRALPQIGWNTIRLGRSSALFNGVGKGVGNGVAAEPHMYFVNSFRVRASADAVAYASYAGEFVAAAERGNVRGVQFHPERSSLAGAQLLRNFVSLEGGVEA